MSAEPEQTTATVQAEHGSGGGGGNALLSLDPGVLIWTWVTFFILLFILYKFAWKPILGGLAAREKKIRESLENAEKIKQELENLARRQEEAMAAGEIWRKTPAAYSSA